MTDNPEIKPNKPEPVNTAKLVYQDPFLWVLEINGQRFQASRVLVEWFGYPAKPKYQFEITISNDYNPTGRFILAAPTIKKLLAKIARHPYKLVPPSWR